MTGSRAFAVAAALAAAPVLAQAPTNVPPPPLVQPGATAEQIGSGFSTIGSAATKAGEIQEKIGKNVNAQGNSLLDFGGDGTRGDGNVAAGQKNQRLGKLVGAGGGAISATGNVINATDAYYRGDTAGVIDQSSRALTNAGGAVGTYVPGVGGMTKAAGAAGRTGAALMKGDLWAAGAAAAEFTAYGASCAAGYAGGGGPAGCDKAVDAADTAIDYGNRAVGYGIDKYFEAKDQAAMDAASQGFAAMRARHSAAAEEHAAINEADAREAAAQAAAQAQADADARAAYNDQVASGQAAQMWSNIAAAATAYAAPRSQAPAAAPAPASGACHPGHDEAAHPGGCHQQPAGNQ